MFVNTREKKTRSKYEEAIRKGGAVIDPYLTSGMGDPYEISGLGDPIGDFVGNVKGQISELRMGVTVAAACSTAAAIGVLLMLMTMPKKR